MTDLESRIFSMTADWDVVNGFSRRAGGILQDSGIYCLNPPKNDDCPIGICPNPDVDGPLVRIAYYVTAFCLTVLIFHAPKRVKEAFYYQMSTVYALLITCSVSIIQANISRLHATIAIFIASSPVSIYFLVYSIRAFWGKHSLDEVLGKKCYLNRGMVFFAAGIWTSIVVYTSLDSTRHRFSQGSCSTITAQEVFGLQWAMIGGIPYAAIAGVTLLSWVISIVRARKEIWPPGERYRPKFATVWSTIGRRYPFVFFMSIGLVPMAIWIWTTELTVLFGEIYNPYFSFTFGQILAVFIAVPPFLQVCQLVPQFWSWIINLSWIACCWRRKRRLKRSAGIEEPDSSLEVVNYTLLENPVPSEGQNDRFCEGRREMQESTTHLESKQYYGP